MRRAILIPCVASLAALLCAALPARADEDSDAAMRQAPAAAGWSQRAGADRATRGGTRTGPVGPGSSETMTNGANADVGNSTAAADAERLPQMGTPRTH
ncbi:MAG TPA: hypothetical protein VGL86_32675 [Polyangia bacterium]|jgi:hypothetical protein